MDGMWRRIAASAVWHSCGLACPTASPARHAGYWRGTFPDRRSGSIGTQSCALPTHGVFDDGDEADDLEDATRGASLDRDDDSRTAC